MEPTVAIGVPVYNGEKHLEECLNSILLQTYRNWECVVINNQSTDKSAQIAESFVEKDKRFKLVTNPEFVDITTNFNNTLKYSKERKYFKVVCADDWIFPEYLEKMVALMEQHAQAGICSSYRIDSTQVNSDRLDIYKGPVFSGKEVLFRHLFNEIDITGSETTVLYRTETLKKIDRYPTIYSYESFHSDTSLAYELLNISDLGFVFQVLSYTRRHEGTFTSRFSHRFQTYLNFRENELFKYKALYPELKNEYNKVRSIYGLFLLKTRLMRDKKCSEWHNQHLNKERKYSTKEYMTIIVNSLINKLINRKK